MTPAELETICQRLYGPRWQSAFARDIARERETINRWARGRSPIPKAVVAWLEGRHSAQHSPYRGYTWEDVAVIVQENRILKEQLKSTKG